MPMLKPSSVILSTDHEFDLRLRTIFLRLWLSLPLFNRKSWETHPDANLRGTFLSFFWTNYQRWRNREGPLLLWPEPEWGPAPLAADYHCEANGNEVEGWIDFDYFEHPCTLALAFYQRHRFTVFERGLKGLYYANHLARFNFRVPSLKPGWQKGIIGVFNRAGFLYTWNYLPVVFCK